MTYLNSLKGLRLTIKDLALFSLPIILGQLGQMLIGFGDSLVAAKYSTDTVAAVGIALGFINPFFLFGIGILNAVSPMLAIKRGKGESVDHYFNECVWMSFFIFIGMFICVHLIKFIIPMVGIEARLIPLINTYIDILVWSFFPAYIYQVAKEFLQSKENVFFPNLIAIIFVFVNIFLNYLMVFGKWGFPEMGISGTAWASVIVRVLMAILMLLYLKHRPSLKFNLNFIKEMVRFGLPVGFMFLFEVCAFCLVSILAGKFGVVQAATNTIVLNLGSLAFMIPLSLSFGVSVKIGKYYGSGDIQKVKEYALSSFVITFFAMLFTSVSFIIFPRFFVTLFSNDPEVIALGMSLFVIMAIFQLFDGFQAILAGGLRGLGVTKELTYAATASYWILGIPFGIWLAFSKDLKAYGLWIGLAVSLFILSIILSVLLSKRIKSLELKGMS